MQGGKMWPVSVEADCWPRQSFGSEYISQSQRCGLMEISLVWHKSQLLKSHKNPHPKMMEHIINHSWHLPGLWYKHCDWGEGQRNFGNVFKIIIDIWAGTKFFSVSPPKILPNLQSLSQKLPSLETSVILSARNYGSLLYVAPIRDFPPRTLNW